MIYWKNWKNKSFFLYFGLLSQIINLTAYRQFNLFSSSNEFFTPFFFFFVFFGLFLGNTFNISKKFLYIIQILFLLFTIIVLFLPPILFQIFYLKLFHLRNIEIELLFSSLLIIPLNLFLGIILKDKINETKSDSHYYFWEIIGSFFGGLLFTAIPFITHSPIFHLLMIISLSIFFLYIHQISNTFLKKILLYLLFFLLPILFYISKHSAQYKLTPTSNLYQINIDSTEYLYLNNKLLCRSEYYPNEFMCLDIALAYMPESYQAYLINFFNPNIISHLNNYYLKYPVLFQFKDHRLWENLKKLIKNQQENYIVKFLSSQEALINDSNICYIIQIPSLKELHSYHFIKKIINLLKNKNGNNMVIFYYNKQNHYYSEEELNFWRYLLDNLKIKYLQKKIINKEGFHMIFSNVHNDSTKLSSIIERSNNRLTNSDNKENIIITLENILMNPFSMTENLIINHQENIFSPQKLSLEKNENITKIFRKFIQVNLIITIPIFILLFFILFSKKILNYNKGAFIFFFIGFLSYAHFIFISGKFIIEFGNLQIYIGLINSFFFLGFSIGYYLLKYQLKTIIALLFFYLLNLYTQSSYFFFFFLQTFIWGILHGIILKNFYQKTTDIKLLFKMDFLGVSMAAFISGYASLYYPTVFWGAIIVSAVSILAYQGNRLLE